MQTTYERYIDSVKKMPRRDESQFDASLMLQDKLRTIEFTSDMKHELIVASSLLDLIVPSKAMDEKGLYYILRNHIRFYTTAQDIMLTKAQFIAEEQGKQLVAPDRLTRIFHQKKLTRAMKRICTAEGAYANYVAEFREADEDNLPQTAVLLRLNAVIAATADNNKLQIVYSALSRGLRYDPLKSMYCTDNVIETLF